MIYIYCPLKKNSQRIPGKNTKKKFLGKLLHRFCTEQAVKFSEELSNDDVRVILGTEDYDIKDYYAKNTISNTKIGFHDRTNKPSISSTASSESAMLECIEDFDIKDDDWMFLMQATSPFTRAEDFKGMVDIMKKDDSLSVISVVKSGRFYWSYTNRKELVCNYTYMDRPRGQELGDNDDRFNPMYVENGALYLNKVGRIKEYKNRLNPNIEDVALYEMPKYTQFEIDDEYDWYICEQLYLKLQKQGVF